MACQADGVKPSPRLHLDIARVPPLRLAHLGSASYAYQRSYIKSRVRGQSLPPSTSEARAGGEYSSMMSSCYETTGGCAQLNDGSPSADVASVAELPGVLDGKTVAVIGGGPGGILCAAHLAKLGARVTVYEKWRTGKTASRPGWNIMLGDVAGKSIQAAGLSSDFGQLWTAEGTSQHVAGKVPVYIGAMAGVPLPFTCTALRSEITAHLTAETARVHGRRVEFRAGVSLVGGAVSRGELELEAADGMRERRTVDLVVGADGVHSATRRLLCDQDATMHAQEHPCDVLTLTTRLSPQGPPATYGSLATPCGQRFEVVPESYSLRGATSAFCFAAPGADPGLTTITVGCRRHGDDVTASITASAEWWGRQHGDAALRATFRRCFPHFPLVWQGECVDAILAASPKDLRQSSFVSCSKLGSGRAVLIGDAAHAMPATIGMGCNTALLDCRVLADAAVATGGDLDALAERFTREQLPEVRAVSRLARRMYDFQHLRFHGSRWRALQGLAVSLAFALAGPSQRLPGVLRPKTTLLSLYAGDYEMRRVERDSQRLVGAVAAVVAVAGLGVLFGVLLVLRASRLL